jgi:hypothetical protein
MKIQNRTHWRSDQLLAIARKVAEVELDPEKRRGFTIVVGYGLRDSISGRAPYYGRRLRVRVSSLHVDPAELAFVFAHEMAHTRGMTHKQMRGSPRYCWIDGWRDVYAWASSYPVERATPPAKPSLDAKRLARLAKCQKMLTQWERRQRAATKKVQAWKRRLKTTEKLISEAATHKEADNA